jgi:hypothetical protein
MNSAIRIPAFAGMALKDFSRTDPLDLGLIIDMEGKIQEYLKNGSATSKYTGFLFNTQETGAIMKIH